ncbi:MAG: hypothetical protein ACTSSE_19180 [Candidatus Thorarchaeota archaeon]
MGEFDEFIRSEPKEAPEEEQAKAKQKSANKSAPKGKGKSLTELLVGEEDAHQFAERFGEIGQGITDNPTAQGVMDLSTVVADVAPVVKNAAEYFSGRSATLSEDDAAFLAKIRESQNEGMDMFFNEEGGGMEIGEVAQEPEPVAPIYTGVVPIDADPFQEGLDWATILDAPEYKPKGQAYTYTDLMPAPDLMIKGLEDLAKEAGLDPRKVRSADTQNKINSGSQSTADQIALANGDASGISLDLSSIKEEMAAEKAKQKRTSKVKFDDENEVLVPNNIEEYDPLSVPGFTLPPSPKGSLETLEQMQDRMAEEDIEEDEPEVETPTTEVGEFESDYFGAVSLGDEYEDDE